MSWILFSRSSRQIQLFAGKEPGALVSKSIGVWPAHNDATKSSNGPWPYGTFNWSHYKTHPEQAGFGPSCFSTAYGCNGIHIFSVKGREGMGVHAGRTNAESFPDGVGKKTLGCIRTSEAAMFSINNTHNSDRLMAIIVKP